MSEEDNDYWKNWKRELMAENSKPCRAVREDTHLCGDMPELAPKGKCYFDHQKNCNAWCLCWKGDEDDEEVKKIREIQENNKNSGLPKYKVVEEQSLNELILKGSYDRYLDWKSGQLDKEVMMIVKGTISKVIMASLASGIPCDPDTSDGINYIETCLKKLKKNE